MRTASTSSTARARSPCFSDRPLTKTPTRRDIPAGLTMRKSFGGIPYGKPCAYYHGRRYGQPLRRAQADHARGRQRRDHHGLLAVRRLPGGLPQGRVRHQKGTRGGFPRHRRQPCGEPDGRAVCVPVAGRCAGVVHRSRRARKALGHGARRARLPERDRRPVRRHQRRRFLRRGGIPRAL